MRRIFAMAAWVVGFSCAAAHAAETELVGSQTVWRVWVTEGPRVNKEADGKITTMTRSNPPRAVDYNPKTALLSALPPSGWSGPDCDDSSWCRYGEELFFQMGRFGCVVDDNGGGGSYPALVCLRTRFGVSNPSKATTWSHRSIPN